MFEAEEKIQGWCPVELMTVLNDVVTRMPNGEQYLEIGTFCGRSLAAALKGNQARAIVIDPLDLWTQNGFIWEIFAKTLANFGLNSRVTLYQEKSETFSEDLPKIGVFFYDGSHDSGHTYESLNKYLPFLADKSTIIVDDYNIFGGEGQVVYPGHELDLNIPVKIDTERWIREHKDIIFAVTYTNWLNGQAIIHIKK